MHSRRRTLGVALLGMGILIGGLWAGQSLDSGDGSGMAPRAFGEATVTLDCGDVPTDVPPFDGYVPNRQMPVAKMVAEYDIELPTWAPKNFELVDQLGMIDEMKFSGQSVIRTYQIVWHNKTLATVDAQDQSTYDSHIVLVLTDDPDPVGLLDSDTVSWQLPTGEYYSLYTSDSSVTMADLEAMACTMPSYPGSCE